MTAAKIEQALSPAMLKALRKAAERPRGNFCPIPGIRANAETMLLAALDRRGFIEWDGPIGPRPPRINDAGRAALSKAES